MNSGIQYPQWKSECKVVNTGIRGELGKYVTPLNGLEVEIGSAYVSPFRFSGNIPLIYATRTSISCRVEIIRVFMKILPMARAKI